MTMTCRDGTIGNLFSLVELSCISVEEQDQFEHSPNLLIAPVLAHDVSGIVLPLQESKVDELGSNGFMYMRESVA